MTFGHLAGALHELLEALGGTPRVWRVDRMATAVVPGTDRLNPQFAQMAKHYGVDVAVCPAHRPQRKGVVEAAVKYATQRWWRTTKVASMSEAQRSIDAWSIRVADGRLRGGQTVGELGAAEPLRPLPQAAFAADIVVERVASRSALVAFEANFYSVSPEHAGRRVEVRAAVGEPVLRVFSSAGALIATHRRASAGAGQTIRLAEHATALKQAVLDAFETRTSCASKVNRPPGAAALAELAERRGHSDAATTAVADLARYAALAEAC